MNLVNILTPWWSCYKVGNYFHQVPGNKKVISKAKGWFTLDAAVCVFRSGLCQPRDRKFSISLWKRNCLQQTHAENAVMWMTLKCERENVGNFPSIVHSVNRKWLVFWSICKFDFTVDRKKSFLVKVHWFYYTSTKHTGLHLQNILFFQK